MDKVFLKKKDLARRYGGVTIRTIERMWEEGRLPPPDIYNGPSPLWSETSLEKHERRHLNVRRTRTSAASNAGAGS